MSFTLRNTNTPLPLQSVAAEVSIVDVLARITLSQNFLNRPSISASILPATSEDLEAIYTFPVPPGAAVCAFEAILDDGTTIVGVVKEKNEAKKEYDQAVSEGRQAALAMHERTDAFTISVGAIPPNASVTVKIAYVIELLEDSNADEVRFVLPTTIAPKYGGNIGQSHYTVPSNIGGLPDYKVSISASIEMAEPIRSIASPSHSIRMDMGTLSPQPASTNFNFNPNHAHVSLTTESYLDRDFVLTITAAGLDSPRGMSEAFQAPSHAFAPSTFTTDGISPDSIPDPTTAIALTLVPRFNLAPVASQEYIFVCDRSGSMGGFKIKALQSALQLLLRSLPTNNTFLQIVSFGDNHSSLFPNSFGREPKSSVFEPSSLKQASEHVDTFNADYGGTDIKQTLADGVFKVRRTDIPTAVFVLTDGETWDLDGILDTIRLAVSASHNTHNGLAPLRVFTLGIGNAVDAAMVGGMARVGNGIAQFVGENERMEGKVMKLLRAARVPGVTDVYVEWGEPSQPALTIQAVRSEEEFEIIPTLSPSAAAPSMPPLSLFNPTHFEVPISHSFPLTETSSSAPQPVLLSRFPPVQQGPKVGSIPNLYSGSRTLVYAILQTTIPPLASVVLRGKIASGQELELAIPIRSISSSGVAPLSFTFAPKDAPLIHTLAARRLIEDLRPPTPRSGFGLFNNRTVGPDSELRARTVRLGLTYNLASEYTSFIAAEAVKDDAGVVKTRPRRLRTEIVATRPDLGGHQHTHQYRSPFGAFGQSAAIGAGSGFSAFGAPSVAYGQPVRAYASASAFGQSMHPVSIPQQASLAPFGSFGSSLGDAGAPAFGSPAHNQGRGFGSALGIPTQSVSASPQNTSLFGALGSRDNSGTTAFRPSAAGRGYASISAFGGPTHPASPPPKTSSAPLFGSFGSSTGNSGTTAFGQSTPYAPPTSPSSPPRPSRNAPTAPIVGGGSRPSAILNTGGGITSRGLLPPVTLPNQTIAQPTFDDTYSCLIKLQHFDGSFSTLSTVTQTLRLPPSLPPFDLLFDSDAQKESIWAVCIALAWLDVKCATRKDEWEMFVEKSLAYLREGVAQVLQGTVLEGQEDQVVLTLGERAQAVVRSA